MDTSPYVTQDEVVLQEIHDAAQKRFEAQLTAALAADQRALIFAGFVAAAAAAFGGAAAPILADGTEDLFLGWLALFAAIGMIAAMFCAVYAARPTKWYFPGGRPDDWTDDIATGKSKVVRLQELVANFDERIAHNDRLMKVNGQWLRASTVIALLTLVLSAGALVQRAGLATI